MFQVLREHPWRMAKQEEKESNADFMLAHRYLASQFSRVENIYKQAF